MHVQVMNEKIRKEVKEGFKGYINQVSYEFLNEFIRNLLTNFLGDKWLSLKVKKTNLDNKFYSLNIMKWIHEHTHYLLVRSYYKTHKNQKNLIVYWQVFIRNFVKKRIIHTFLNLSHMLWIKVRALLLL